MIVLVTGGSASGKSEYAEGRALSLAEAEHKKRIYLATMQPFGEDAARRIERHRQLRAGKGFETVERYRDIEALITGESPESEAFRHQATGSVVMLECLSNLTANEMFSGAEVDPEANIEMVKNKILKGIDALAEVADHLIIVSINVFDEGMQQYDVWTQAYIRCLGVLNQALTVKADEAVEVVYSIPVSYKEGPPCSL